MGSCPEKLGIFNPIDPSSGRFPGVRLAVDAALTYTSSSLFPDDVSVPLEINRETMGKYRPLLEEKV